jgi:hypothetical protein
VLKLNHPIEKKTSEDNSLNFKFNHLNSTCNLHCMKQDKLNSKLLTLDYKTEQMLIKKKNLQLHVVVKGDGHGGMGTSTTPSSICVTFLIVGLRDGPS